MTVRNLTITFEQGRMRTCRFPRFSALLMLFKASAKTFMRTILSDDFSFNKKGHNENLELHEHDFKRGTLTQLSGIQDTKTISMRQLNDELRLKLPI